MLSEDHYGRPHRLRCAVVDERPLRIHATERLSRECLPGLSKPQKHRAFVPLCIKCSDAGGGADRSLGGEPHRVAGDDLARHITEPRSEV